MSTGPAVIVDRQDAIGRIVLNRPEAMNALGPEMGRQLSCALAELAQDSGVRCVVLTGSGPHFMAGGDVRHFDELLRLPARERDAGFTKLIVQAGDAVNAIAAMPKPVIAAVRGAAAGFGLSLMCSCDLVVAGESMYCKLAYGQLGASPDGGGSYNLPRLLGLRRALELALLDERIDARRALELGLVTRVVGDDAVEGVVAEMAARLAQAATGALGRTKRLMRASFSRDLPGQMEAERLAFLAGVMSQDFAAAVAAFLAKRKPEFGGR